MMDNTRRLSAGSNLNLPVSGKDEIAHLDRFFHEMAAALTVARDTERSMLEQLTASESRIRSMVDSMPVGLITVDLSGVIKSVNPRSEELFGYGAGELAGTPLEDLFALKQGQALLATIAQGKRQELAARTRLNAEFPAEVSFNSFLTREGEHYLVSVQDITERHELEKMKQQFYAMITHDLRTPLMAVQGSLNLLSEGLAGDLTERAERLVASAERSIDRLVELINNLLDFEKLQSGKFELVCKPVRLGSVVTRSIEEVASLAKARALTIQAPDPDIEINADEPRLVQVLVNLLSNAIKFSPAQGMIIIEADVCNESLTVSVSDEGPGVPAEQSEMLFQRFRQLQHGTRPKEKGTGLGLAICKMIVEQHGGEIGCKSIAGKGSTFWFKLPLQSHACQTT